VINYQSQNWWEVDKFQEDKFDIIIDTVGGGNFYERAEKVLKTCKQGGSFVAVTGDNPKPDCNTSWKLIKFFAKMGWQVLYPKLKTTTLPKYVLVVPHGETLGRKEVLDWMQEGSLTIKIDGNSPLPFTAEGVCQAFSKVGSGHAHGKVVVKIAEWGG